MNNNYEGMNCDEFKKIRDELKLSQSELSKLLDVTRQTIWKYETNKYHIPKTVQLSMFFLRNKTNLI